MGMYTGFVCKIKVKKKYHDLIEFINNGDYDFERGLWQTAYDKFKYEFIKKYMNDSRSGFIPRGGYTYNDDQLNNYIKENDKYFNNGVWFFGCDLKNYNLTIEKFCNIILPVITEKIYFIKSHYEEEEYEEDHKYYEINREIKLDMRDDNYSQSSTCKFCGARIENYPCEYCDGY